MSEAADTGYAPDRWAFDEEVTRVFDDMLGRSIPQLGTMRQIVHDVASAFVKPKTIVADVGCSRGDALASLIDMSFPGVRFEGFEVSEPMVEAARDRFGDRTDVKIFNHDLRQGVPYHGITSLYLSVLTIMFVPINYRQRIISEIRENLIDGGALVLVEKVIGTGPRIDDCLQANYHRHKVDHGYSPDDVQRKRLALEGVLVPLTARWNEDMLRLAGFSEVDCFWAWGPFRAWVAVK